MYLKKLKKVLVESLQTTFDEEYVNPDFRNLSAFTRYPVEKTDYPGIWVDFEPSSDLQKGGIGNHAYLVDPDTLQAGLISMWRFQGWATFTGVALTDLERDNFYDELVRVMAFGNEHDSTRDFRSLLENNEWLAVNFDWDEIGHRGFNQAPGTPWGTDEVIYEFTIVMECFGEFMSNSLTRDLMPLERIDVVPEKLPAGSVFPPPPEAAIGENTWV